MSGIEGSGSSAYSLCEVGKAGLEGALTLSKRRIENRLSQRGFVNAGGGSIAGMKARLETAMVPFGEVSVSLRNVAEIMAALQAATDQAPQQLQGALSRIEAERVSALLK